MLKVKIVDLENDEVLIDETVEAAIGGVVRGRKKLNSISEKVEADMFILGYTGPKEINNIASSLTEEADKIASKKIPKELKDFVDLLAREAAKDVAKEFAEDVASGKVKVDFDKPTERDTSRNPFKRFIDERFGRRE